jgi:hypothetical protein
MADQEEEEELPSPSEYSSAPSQQTKAEPSTPNNDQGKPSVLAQVNPAGLSDVPTARDGIGFRPYVRAIAWFLSNKKTRPPLTISIEGPWGSGKSSFMLQLEDELKAPNSEQRKQYYVKFNAWRSDKDEALWAAFALTFIKQLEPHIDWVTRVRANVGLLWRRFAWRRAWLPLTRLALFSAMFLGLTGYALFSDLLRDRATKAVVILVPWLVAAAYGLEKSKKIFGNPLSYDLSKYVSDLKYEDKVAFIDRFHDDFSKIVKSYISENGRVFVFIDDLDRCEVPRAAELLQAINLLLSADQGNLFFVLGLDREMVAAGIAAKNEKILPYLAAGRAPSSKENPDHYRSGVEYGYSFMEKFVQVPFRVPRPDVREIAQWVPELLTNVGSNDNPPKTFASTVTPRQRDALDMRALTPLILKKLPKRCVGIRIQPAASQTVRQRVPTSRHDRLVDGSACAGSRNGRRNSSLGWDHHPTTRAVHGDTNAMVATRR